MGVPVGQAWNILQEARAVGVGGQPLTNTGAEWPEPQDPVAKRSVERRAPTCTSPQIQLPPLEGKRRFSDGTSAKDMLQQRKDIRPIITFCKAIDTMLGGGIPRGEMTEFCKYLTFTLWLKWFPVFVSGNLKWLATVFLHRWHTRNREDSDRVSPERIETSIYLASLVIETVALSLYVLPGCSLPSIRISQGHSMVAGGSAYT